ncbi:S41 family peptidase [Candidatus Parcubacteria bacterium]|jgi:carboxyl-terminal processing protease|nr:MAG: S41 family peptidase [Candidatus Parcubacteria bacterium]
MWNNKWKISGGALFVLIIIIVSGFVGYTYGNKRSIVITDPRALIKSDFSLFWEAVDVVQNKYVDTSAIKDDSMLYGAIRGMIASLEDPYSDFFDPSDAKKFDEDLNGMFGGIGAEIGLRDGIITIISPLKGNPAEKVGLLPLDRILRIDNTTTTNMSTESAVKIIRGKPGTEVRLLIMRNSWKEPKEIKITRAIIEVPTLDVEIKTLSNGKNVAHLQLHNFNANVPSLFRQKLFEIADKNPEGIILDLRNNPGGFLDVAVDISGWFLESGKTVVKEKLRTGEETIRFASGNGLLVDMPVVVLVNGGSASAAEILAGAIRDINGSKLIGEKTFGKGSVQEVVDLKDGSKMKVTIAHWLTPDGTKIDKTGLEPDITVVMKETDIEQKKDPQLDKALQLIEDQLK